MIQAPPQKNQLPVLTTDRHDRDAAGFEYVYPVVSRRAQGVSIGINLNPNNACNWRCVYCQVEGLQRGAAPPLELSRLESELIQLLNTVTSPGFLEQHVPAESRRLSDLALSGNGEPTSSAEFPQVIELLARLRESQHIPLDLPITLITNGSLANRASVQKALKRLADIGGRVWFKLDAGTDVGLRRVNSANTHLTRHLDRLRIVARLCPTFVQSCWFMRANQNPDPEEVTAYVGHLTELHRQGIPIEGVQLYTLARKSYQPEAPELGPVDPRWLEALAKRLRDAGLRVQVAS